MLSVPTPSNESERLNALSKIALIDSAPDAYFDGLVALAAQICNAPIALFTLIDKNRQWFKAKYGTTISETDRNSSFCGYTILQQTPLEVINLANDERFAANPWVIGPPYLRYYYGIPITDSQGLAIGSFCVLNTSDTPLSSQQKQQLHHVKKQLDALLELHIAKLHALKTTEVLPINHHTTTLEEERRLLHTLINNLPDAIYIKDKEGRKTIVNNADLAFLGITNAEAAIGKTDLELFGGEKGVSSYADDMHVLTTGNPIYNREEKIFSSDGSNCYWLLTSKVPIYNNNGVITGLVGIGRNITEHKIIDKILSDREEQLHLLANNIPNGAIYRLLEYPNGHLEYLFVSNSIENITGIAASDIRKDAMQFKSKIYPADLPLFVSKANEAKANNHIFDCEFRQYHQNGELRWYHSRAIPKHNANGEIVWDGIFIDITQHKLVEIALQQSENNLNTVFENTEVGYIFMSPQLAFISFNTAAIHFTALEHTLPLQVGENLYHYYPKEHHEKLTLVTKQVLQGQVFETDKKIITLQGEEKWFHIKLSHVANRTQEVAGILMAMEDITTRKKDELELKKSFNLVNEQNKRLLNFSYIVSHNLRSHTSNIQSIAKLMDFADSDEERNELLSHLKTVSNALDETMHHLNEVVSIQNHVNINVQSLSLLEYIHKTLDILKDDIQTKNVIVRNLVPQNVAVLFNPAYLESVIINFLSNAIKYSHPQRQPEIELTCYRSLEQWVLQISDNGLGMDLKKHGEKLFGLYKTFHGFSNSRGIGLFITKNQIEAMGGKIEVSSQVNVGTTFKIYFK